MPCRLGWKLRANSFFRTAAQIVNNGEGMSPLPIVTLYIIPLYCALCTGTSIYLKDTLGRGKGRSEGKLS